MERDRANFCEWLQPQPGVWQAGASTVEDARAKLDTLFGEKKDEERVEPALPESSKADRARAELEELFGRPKKSYQPALKVIRISASQ